MLNSINPARQEPVAPPFSPAVQLDPIKTRQRATWASGNYGIIGTTLQMVGESLCEAVDLRAGSRVLDVAAGNGNCSLAAARRWCEVTATDYVPALLEDARRRAQAEGFSIRFEEADAEQLPFEDGRFDVVLSSFGVMFTPDHAQAAREMVRVCKPQGRIGLANWTPDGFIGQLFAVVGRHVPPPPGVAPPVLWGLEAHLADLFGASAADVRVTHRDFVFRYRSPQHWLEVFRTWYGPVHKAFATLSDEGQEQLAREIEALIDRCNVSGDSTMVVPSRYAEVVITTR